MVVQGSGGQSIDCRLTDVRSGSLIITSKIIVASDLDISASAISQSLAGASDANSALLTVDAGSITVAKGEEM